jgi:hypothetical protein
MAIVIGELCVCKWLCFCQRFLLLDIFTHNEEHLLLSYFLAWAPLKSQTWWDGVFPRLERTRQLQLHVPYPWLVTKCFYWYEGLSWDTFSFTLQWLWMSIILMSYVDRVWDRFRYGKAMSILYGSLRVYFCAWENRMWLLIVVFDLIVSESGYARWVCDIWWLTGKSFQKEIVLIKGFSILYWCVLSIYNHLMVSCFTFCCTWRVMDVGMRYARCCVIFLLYAGCSLIWVTDYKIWSLYRHDVCVLMPSYIPCQYKRCFVWWRDCCRVLRVLIKYSYSFLILFGYLSRFEILITLYTV